MTSPLITGDFLMSDNDPVAGIMTNWSASHWLVDFIVFLVLLCSEFGGNSLPLTKRGIDSVQSALMSQKSEPYRAPLRLVTFRKPVAKIVSGRAIVHIDETLECGHFLQLIPGEHEPLVAKRRRCSTCFALEFPQAAFPSWEEADDISQSQSILEYLKRAELDEPDVWMRDDYRVAWQTVLQAAKGNPDPWNYAFAQYYGKNLAKALVGWAERDFHNQKQLDKIAREVARLSPPKKPAQSVRSVSREDQA